MKNSFNKSNKIEIIKLILQNSTRWTKLHHLEKQIFIKQTEHGNLAQKHFLMINIFY